MKASEVNGGECFEAQDHEGIKREFLSCEFYTTYPAAYAAARARGWQDVALTPLKTPRNGCVNGWAKKGG
jgi:hypothetical protein